jgi:hypothetical protein
MVTRRIAVLLGIVVVGAAFAAAAPAVASPASTAKLRLVKDLPLTLRGSAFKPAELVTVTVHVGDRKLARTARTSGTGAFSVSFAGVRFDPCKATLSVVARGRRTGMVRLAVPMRECAAP